MSRLFRLPFLQMRMTPLARVALCLVLASPLAGCGTKTELLMPNGKPTPAGQRDPSQPPSPISR